MSSLPLYTTATVSHAGPSCEDSTRVSSAQNCLGCAEQNVSEDGVEDIPSVMDDAFVRSLFPSLHRAAWKMTGDATAAEDLAQDTLVAAYRSWDSFDGRSTRRTWIHGILILQTRRYFRSTQRLRRRIERYFLADDRKRLEESSEDSIATAEWNKSIWASVALLPQPQAEAILLHFGQQLTYEETAQALRCAVGTVKSRVHHGLKRLRESHSIHPDFDH